MTMIDPSTPTVDALVVGAGPAGCTSALLLARGGLTVALLDRRASAPSAAEDPRTTALLEPAVATLERAGVWARLAPLATPLSAMRLVDAAPGADRGRGEAVFEARELERQAFGMNVAAADLAAVLRAEAAATPGVTLIAPAELGHCLAREDGVLARLGDGRRIRAALLVGADGRDSAVRRMAGIEVRRLDHGARAFAFIARHARPHRNVSIEIHRTGGPFTFAPHRDAADGAPRSGVVWMEREATALRLAALDDAAFERAANERSLGLLGALRLDGPRASWPVVSQLATRATARRTALIAEALHVAPPIGAQGLNLSIADAAALADCVIAARASGRDIGAAETLAPFARARLADATARLAAVGALALAADGAAAPIRTARALGLGLLGAAGPLRRAVMRFGLGAGSGAGRPETETSEPRR